jgi:hypothetical protein
MSRVEQRPTNPYPIVRFPRPREFPLSVGQERLWWHDRLDPARRRQDHVTGGWRRADGLDRKAFAMAVDALVHRHEILRTRFVQRSDGIPVQQVVEDVPATIIWAGKDWREAVDQCVAEPFDLACPPLFRVVVADLDAGGSGLFLVLHHIITDRWSMDLIARDLFELYAALPAERAPRLPDLAVQYGDYALWQRRFLDSPHIRPQLVYWKQTLACHSRPEPPTDRPWPQPRDTVGREVSVQLTAESTAALAAMAWRTRGSPAIVVTAVLCAVLGALTEQTDIVVGAVVADRPRPELHDLVGCFINTVALRADLSTTLTFRELVKHTRGAWMAANANQDVPFEHLATALGADPEDQRIPVFNAIVNHGGGWPGADRTDTPPSWSPSIPDTATYELSLCTLMLNTVMVDGRLQVRFVYDPSLFDDATIVTLASRYVGLLEQGMADPDHSLSKPIC